MKKIFTLCAVAIVALGAFSCQKDNVADVQAPEFNEEGLQKYTFTVRGVETKLDYTVEGHILTPTWKVNDKIFIQYETTGGQTKSALFEVKNVKADGSATVEGYAEEIESFSTFIYSPLIDANTTIGSSTFDLSSQTGALDKTFPAIYYDYDHKTNEGTGITTVKFSLKTCILEISKVIGVAKGANISSIIVEGTNIAGGKFGDSGVTELSGNKDTVNFTSNFPSVSDDYGTLSNSVFISLTPGSISKITVKTSDNKVYCWQPTDAISLTGVAYKYVSSKTFTAADPTYPGTDQKPVKVGNIWWAPVNCGGNDALYKWNDAQNCCPPGWRTPSSVELTALKNTSETWSSNPAGRYYNGNIFFPAAGYKPNSGELTSYGTDGYYWSSNQYDSDHGIYLRFDDENTHVDNNDGNAYKNRSCSVRCVKDADN